MISGVGGSFPETRVEAAGKDPRRGGPMYPLLSLDSDRASWIESISESAWALAREHSEELKDAQRLARFPAGVYREMGRLGLLAPIVPEVYGGSGGGVPEYAVISEEVGRHGLVSMQISAQGQRWLLDWGTEEQKQWLLAGMSKGEIIFSESISEPQAGSSFKNLKATARRSGADWVLNGHKTHVNLGADCQVTLFYAIADEGLTSFLVDMSSSGVETRRTDPVGLRQIPTADVIFDDVRVPDSALLGGPGQGLETFLTTFNFSRLGNASELIGLGRRALALGVEYASEREVGSNKVTDFQGIQWLVADRFASLHAASLARDHAALAAESGDDISLATTLAKKLAIDAAQEAAVEVLALVGGHGLYHETPFTDILNDVRVLRVAGGSLEILRNYVARRVLGDSDRLGL